MSLQSNLLENHTPTGREEAWRFTPLKRLGGMHDGTATAVERNSLAVKGSLPAGASFTHQDIDAVTETDDAIVNRIRQFTKKGAVLAIAPNAEIADPIFLHRSAFGTDSAEFARVLIKAGNHSKSVVVIENSGDTHLAEDLEIVVEPGAQLTLIALQEWGAKTIHAARHHAIVDRDATFKSIVVTVGGDVVRLLPTVDFVAPGASCDLSGVYFATAGQFF